MTQKAELFVKSQGVRGKNVSYEKRGYATLFIDRESQYIYVNSYRGKEQLGKCKIEIPKPDGSVFEFDGFGALISQLERGAQPEIKTVTGSPEEIRALADQQRKNVALIMAAPELLEALEQLLTRVEVKDTWDKKAVLAAQAAITKAKGE